MKHCALVPCPIKKKWLVYSEYIYVTKTGVEIVVPRGFETDLASIPSFFKWLYPKCRVDYATASVVHDVLLKNYTGLGNDFANRVFKEILDITTSERTENLFFDAVKLWSKMKSWWHG